jgi:hypothetical protein
MSGIIFGDDIVRNFFLASSCEAFTSEDYDVWIIY